MPFLAPLIPFLPSIIGAGASIAGSVVGSGSKTTTSTPTLSPGMQGDQDQLMKVLQGMLNPSTDSTLAPIKSAAETTINRNYANLPNQITAQASARGFGSSGKVGGGLLGIDSARLGDLSNLDGQMAQLGSQRQMNSAQLIQQMISSMRGTSSTTPNQGLAAGLLSGGSSLTSLSTLHTLSQMINGGGSSPSIAGAGGGGPDPALLSGEGWGDS